VHDPESRLGHDVPNAIQRRLQLGEDGRCTCEQDDEADDSLNDSAARLTRVVDNSFDCLRARFPEQSLRLLHKHLRGLIAERHARDRQHYGHEGRERDHRVESESRGQRHRVVGEEFGDCFFRDLEEPLHTFLKRPLASRGMPSARTFTGPRRV
jgi:hypothetical protein